MASCRAGLASPERKISAAVAHNSDRLDVCRKQAAACSDAQQEGAEGDASAAQPAQNDLARLHSITSSARARSVGGTVRPMARAVLRFMTSWNLVGRCTGEVGRFVSSEYAVDVSCRTAPALDLIRPVAHENAVAYLEY